MTPRRQEAVARQLATVLGQPVTLLGHPATLLLTRSNPVLHPSVLLGHIAAAKEQGCARHGNLPVFATPPRLYEDAPAQSGDHLTGVDADLTAIKTALGKHGIDLPGDLNFRDYVRSSYGANAKYGNNQETLNTCEAYRGFHVPTDLIPDVGHVPKLDHRFFHEDLAVGLVTLRRLADLLKVPVSTLDALMLGMQAVCGKSYLRQDADGLTHLDGPDLKTSGDPCLWPGYQGLETFLRK